MRDLIFKILRNIPFYIRGILFRITSVFSENRSVGFRLRIDKSVGIIIHPNAKIKLGPDIFIGRGSFISVLPKGNLSLGMNVGIGNNNHIVCHSRIEIGEATILGPNVMIYDHNHKYNSKEGVNHKEFDVGEIIIGKNCWLGAGCTILKNVHIGNNVVIAAGSVVTKDIPDGVVVAGIPAKIIK